LKTFDFLESTKGENYPNTFNLPFLIVLTNSKLNNFVSFLRADVNLD